MTLEQMAEFDRDGPFPSYFANALGAALGLIAFGFTLVKQSNTTVRVPAGSGAGAVVIALRGRWRWRETTVTVAHPGGAAGLYPVFVTAADNDVVMTPDPFTDNTDYSFGLSVLAPGATPTGVDLYRQVGVAEWDGTKIVRLHQTVPALAPHAFSHFPGGADPIVPQDIGAVPDDDPALTDSRPPSGPAGGDLAGSDYPNPVVDDAWQNYVPAIASDDGNAALGDASLAGAYKLLGGVCHFQIKLSIQAGSTFNGGAGEVSFSLPVQGGAQEQIAGSCRLLSSDGRWWAGILFLGAHATAVFPMFPASPTDTHIGHLQNESTGGPLFTTDVPNIGGFELPLDDGSVLIISGAYRTV